MVYTYNPCAGEVQTEESLRLPGQPSYWLYQTNQRPCLQKLSGHNDRFPHAHTHTVLLYTCPHTWAHNYWLGRIFSVFEIEKEWHASGPQIFIMHQSHRKVSLGLLWLSSSFPSSCSPPASSCLSGVSDTVDLGWYQELCTCNRFPDDVGLAGQDTTLRSIHLQLFNCCIYSVLINNECGFNVFNGPLELWKIIVFQQKGL